MKHMTQRGEMKIDFALKSKAQVRGGLIMELAPDMLDDSIAIEESVYLSENAFGFIERCITKCWPAYANYGHWGRSKIPVDTWRDIVNLLLELRANLVEARTPDEVIGLGFIFDDVRKAFHSDFGNMRLAISKMITELVSWLESKMPICSHITIIGI